MIVDFHVLLRKLLFRVWISNSNHYQFKKYYFRALSQHSPQNINSLIRRLYARRSVKLCHLRECFLYLFLSYASGLCHHWFAEEPKELWAGQHREPNLETSSKKLGILSLQHHHHHDKTELLSQFRGTCEGYLHPKCLYTSLPAFAP